MEADGTGVEGIDVERLAGGGQGDPEALTLLAAAAEASAGRSVRGELTVAGALSEQVPGGGPVTTFEVDHRGNVSVESAFGMGDAALGGVAMSDSLDYRARYVDDAVYIDFPAALAPEFSAEVTEDRPWLVNDSQVGVAAYVAATLCPTPLASLGALPVLRLRSGRTDCSPLSDAVALARWAREAEMVGREEVRGAGTTRVRYVVLLGRLVADSFQVAQGGTLPDLSGDADYDDDWATPEVDESGEPLWDDPLGIGPGATDINVWIDDESLVRRVSMDLSWMFGTDGGGLGFEAAEGPLFQSIVEFYDFDADIMVEAPPAESIAGNMSDLTGPAGPDSAG